MAQLCDTELPGKLKLGHTCKFCVIDVAGSKPDHIPAGAAAAAADAGGAAKNFNRAEKTRLTKESGARQDTATAQRIGGDFTRYSKGDAPYLSARADVFDAVKAKRAAELAANPPPDVEIKITTRDGKVLPGKAWETTPMDIAKELRLEQNALIASVTYTGARAPGGAHTALDVTAADGMEDEEEGAGAAKGELWDLNRALEGDCKLAILRFDDDDAKTAFWHSSAHILGEALEHKYGSYLTIGPPVDPGFYYDSYMGDITINDGDFKDLEAEVKQVVKKKQPFERLVITKEEGLEMFKYNPFKYQLIATKVPDGSSTTVYRCGDLIDLCRGPHVTHTGKVASFKVCRASATNWLGKVENDTLQRVYGISFPDKKLLKEWEEIQKKAEERNHRNVGPQQELFMFHDLSPGSCFFMPRGTRIYNRLVDFIKKQYWLRGYEEIITPNVYNAKLWETSGHWQHYAENMFSFDVEGQTFAMKPMNCPGHCLMFKWRLRSWRELPLRLGDFGVLHRNELSGALTGLVRVRRFQQDDGHIFCTEAQIRDELVSALDFMKTVYGIFGMTYHLERSTRPAKALGEPALWDVAEQAIAEALDEFAGPGNWKDNPGDGAFYGPKIDIKVYDALKRVHQCATVQLDFQLPRRFDLKYRSGDDESSSKMEYPVLIHRAVLGSVERMFGILTEHFGGKWPFWLSPRQIVVVPVAPAHYEYAHEVRAALHKAGFYADVDDSSKTFTRKLVEGQKAQYNFQLVVGDKDMPDKVSPRRREEEGMDKKDLEMPQMTITEAIAMFQELTDTHK